MVLLAGSFLSSVEAHIFLNLAAFVYICIYIYISWHVCVGGWVGVGVRQVFALSLHRGAIRLLDVHFVVNPSSASLQCACVCACVCARGSKVERRKLV